MFVSCAFLATTFPSAIEGICVLSLRLSLSLSNCDLLRFFSFMADVANVTKKKTKKTKTNKFSTAMSWKWLDGNYVLENKPAVFNMQIILLADLKLIAYQWKWRNDNISLRDRIFCWQCGNPASGTEEALPASCRCSRRSFSERLHKRRLVWMRQQSVNSWSSTNC